MLSFFRDAMLAAVYLVVTFYMSPAVTALVLGAGLVLMLLLGGRARAATRLGQEMTRVGGAAYRAVMEHLGGIKMAKSYGAEQRSIALFGELADTVAGANLRAATAQADAKYRFDIGAALVLGLVLYVSIAVLHTPTAVILVLLFAFARVMPLVSNLEQSRQQLLNMLPNLVAVLALESAWGARCDGAAPAAPVHLRRACGSTRLVPVAETADPALQSVGLTIPVGQTTAIIGPSGPARVRSPISSWVCSGRRMARCWWTTRR